MKGALIFSSAALSLVAASGLLAPRLLSGEHDVAIVLSGGGGKGAYEVGVWKAVCEAGLDGRVGAFSGTSAGAIASVLFASVGDPAKCEDVWLSSMTNAFEINTGAILKVLTAGIDKSEENPYAKDGGLMSKTALRRMLSSNVREWPPRGGAAVYATATGSDDGKSTSFRLDALSRDEMLERLLASASIPVIFSPSEIDGKAHVDGYLSDNSPVAPVIAGDPDGKIRTVVVVYLSRRPKRRVDPREVGARRLVEIMPSEEISVMLAGGDIAVVDTRPETAAKLISLGYADAKKALEGL